MGVIKKICMHTLLSPLSPHPPNILDPPLIYAQVCMISSQWHCMTVTSCSLLHSVFVCAWWEQNLISDCTVLFVCLHSTCSQVGARPPCLLCWEAVQVDEGSWHRRAHPHQGHGLEVRNRHGSNKAEVPRALWQDIGLFYQGTCAVCQVQQAFVTW